MKKIIIFVIAAMAVILIFRAFSYGAQMPVAQSHRSYEMVSRSYDFTATEPSVYEFSIIDDTRAVVKDFAITHTKPMHVIVVSKDLANFQHVHPTFDESTGAFKLDNLTFPTSGDYRVFADFAPQSAQRNPSGAPLPVTLYEDIRVKGGSYIPVDIGSVETSGTFDGLDIALDADDLYSEHESMLEFRISRSGKPVTDLEEYLSALGHAVILKEGTLDYIHAHPIEVKVQDGSVDFHVYFPQAGMYKIFAQFQRAGKVTTSDFVIEVKAESGAPHAHDDEPEENLHNTYDFHR